MLYTRGSIAIIVLLSATLIAAPMFASAQAPSTTTPTPKMKLTREKLSEMRSKWKANKPKLKACRAEVRKKGLIGDDRWFFIEDCMDKS